MDFQGDEKRTQIMKTNVAPRIQVKHVPDKTWTLLNNMINNNTPFLSSSIRKLRNFNSNRPNGKNIKKGKMSDR